MKFCNLYKIAPLILIVGISCKEVYYPKTIESSAKIPVIQGMIMENQLPSVTLSWALGYKDTLQAYQQQYINGAQVFISDNLGNSVELSDNYFNPGGLKKSNYAVYGNYWPVSNDIMGVVGRTYTLQVKLPDGSEYFSSPVTLVKNPFIDSLYANPVSKTVYTYGSDNEPIGEQQQGLDILADLSGNTDSLLYYRFNTSVVKEMVVIINPNSIGAQTLYMWSSSNLDNSYSVDLTVTQNHRQVLREHPIGFLRYFYDYSQEWPDRSAPYTVGWVLTFNVYSISGTVYNYYNSIAQQLNSNDQMFATVPSQVKGNIHCSSDPNKTALGAFEASSLTTLYKAFRWMGLKGYQSKVLPYFPGYVYGGTQSNFPPDWWINF